MNHINMRQLLVLAATVVYLNATAQTSGLCYGISDGNIGMMTNLGFGKAETYDVAFHIDGTEMAGLTIRGMRFPVVPGAQASAYRAWLSQELTLSSGTMVPDVAEVEVEPGQTWAEATFAEPVVVGAEGLYAGYSFTVARAVTDEDRAPLMAYTETRQGGFWLHTSRTYRKWQDQSAEFKASCAAQVVLDDALLPQQAAAFAPLPALTAQQDKTDRITLALYNHGLTNVTDIDYTVDVDGQPAGTIHLDLPRPIRADVYARYTQAEVVVPAVSTQGYHDIAYTLTQVNGQPNSDRNATRTATLSVVAYMPRHRALLEEYTGTWCGFCPRGLVGLNIMSERYPADFIGVSYHNADPMEIMKSRDFPSPISGFPAAWVDRTAQADAYYGWGEAGLGIDEVWQLACQVAAPASVDVGATWTDDVQTAIDITVTTQFAQSFDMHHYRVAYMLVADSLHGDTEDWLQTNYYAGSDYSGDTSGEAQDLSEFINGDHYQAGVYYNDVIIAHSALLGDEGSLPETIAEGQTCHATYHLDLATVLNTQGEPIIQDKRHLRLVAILVDTATGEVANANKGIIANSATAIHSAAADSPVYRFYDLSGRRVERTAHGGLYLQTVQCPDGTVRCHKVYRKP